MNRILIAAPHSGSGKTTFCIGLIGALRRRYLRVAPFKVGPDYIDTAYHTRAAGVPASNLDAFLLPENALRSLFAKRCRGMDIAVVEGVMGLYDGIGSTQEASTAGIAALLSTPVILIVDGRGMAASAAALVRGFAVHEPSVKIAAVVFNGVSESHYKILRDAVQRETGIPCIGYLPHAEGVNIKSRHLGILPESELSDAVERIERITDMVGSCVDVDAIHRIASQALPLVSPAPVSYEQRPCTVAVARDAAFNFYYEDSLDTLRAMGARLVFFSPLTSMGLPRCGGVYIGGGFPEVFAGRLAANHSMRRAIFDASCAGMPIYGECGGYMYLSQSISVDGGDYAMCGALPVNANMGRRLSGQFGYVGVTLQSDTPIGRAGTSYRAHEFHHSGMFGEAGAYVAKKASGERSWRGGTTARNTFGAYAHVNFAGEPALAQSFLASCQRFEG